MSRRIVVPVALLLIVVATLFVVFRQQGDGRETATAELGSIDVTIQTVGSLQATNGVTLRAVAGGVVERVGAPAGSVVSLGDIVILFDQQPFDRAVEDANTQLEQAELGLQTAELRLAADTENIELRQDVLVAADRVERAHQAVADAEAARADAVVLAPQDGTVLEVLVREGDAVGANQPVARIARPDQLELLADVDELDLPNVREGAEVRFRLDAFPATEITGVVRSTAPQARQQGGATVFATNVTFEPPLELDIRPGMNADVTIVTAERENVLLIPDRALRTVGDRSYVVVITADGDDEREITLGYRGGGRVEVVSGLTPGDRVVLR